MAPYFSQLWINGSPRPASNGKAFDVFNPATQTVVTRAASATVEDIDLAITEADKAQPAWEALSILARRQILINASNIIVQEKYVKPITEAVTQETGALPHWGPDEARVSAFHLLQGAIESALLQGGSQPSQRVPGGTSIIERRAYGTVFAISPFNAPVRLAARAIAVPLICGNAVVLKSSELSPRCAELLVEALYEAGLPKGVLQLIHTAREDSPKLVAHIIGHKLIRHINFTGSDKVGRIIASEAGKYLKPCVFELGGKNATIVLNDADTEDAARNIMFSAMDHAGQICMSNDRVIVQRGASKALIDALTSLGEKIRSGPRPDAQIPPLITEASAERVLSLINDAKSRGAEVILGDAAHQGAFMKPHIVLGFEPGWPLWEQESFGPVFGIKIVDTEEEAVELANMTDYSLMAAVWTRDIEKGLRISRLIRAGHVGLNGPTFGIEPTLSIHGLGGSTGYGNFDVDHFTQKRFIIITPANNAGKNLPIIRDL
ncbi:hypothetical protein M422DRAFT_35053 [Sphaerobolus stellatus SS14]|uniref:Aldehyde dehydrogenase domain-containing protein n=1 Tax=Sphaerobolus stellatus (strain SS14) TaxID=990650 RepID=A0A0C9VB66_SPHS4|nr:hypothetical protein M422DRAFT_35053 [Sphaerobolus stellatus SS14]